MWVIVCSIPSQLLSLLMYVGKRLVAMLVVKKSAGVAPEVELRECTLHLPPEKQIMQNSFLL